MTKTPTQTENSKTNGQHKNATKKFDYTTIEDQLRTVSRNNNSHPTGVVKPVSRYPIFPPQKPCNQKDRIRQYIITDIPP